MQHGAPTIVSIAPFTAHAAPSNMTHAPSTTQVRDMLYAACGMRCAPCSAQPVECRGCRMQLAACDLWSMVRCFCHIPRLQVQIVNLVALEWHHHLHVASLYCFLIVSARLNTVCKRLHLLELKNEVLAPIFIGSFPRTD